jgi:hypothetical protein
MDMGLNTEESKRLPRGLEDVSHLFLSRAAPNDASTVASNGAPAELHESDSSLKVMQRRFLPRDELLGLLQRETVALEVGMKTMDANIPCEPLGEIELLALDWRNQLAIAEFDDSPNEGLLLRGLAHSDWIVRNVPNLRRMYQNHPVNFSLEPRLLLIAPEFSPLLRAAARHLKSPRINYVKYHAVNITGGTGVFFEHVFGM